MQAHTRELKYPKHPAYMIKLYKGPVFCSANGRRSDMNLHGFPIQPQSDKAARQKKMSNKLYQLNLQDKITKFIYQ